MPRIEIIEKDETSAGAYAQNTDIVYIPGFVDISQKRLFNERREYIGLEAHTPTLFNTVKEFETLCGTQGARFTSSQSYPSKFDNKATPQLSGEGFIEKGAIDPSYIMAKELLAAGLGVIYERVNEDDAIEYVEIKDKPANWDTNYSDYFTYGTTIKLINSPFAPCWYTKLDLKDSLKAGSLDKKGDTILSETEKKKVVTSKELCFEYPCTIKLPVDSDYKLKVMSGNTPIFANQETGVVSVGKNIPFKIEVSADEDTDNLAEDISSQLTLLINVGEANTHMIQKASYSDNDKLLSCALVDIDDENNDNIPLVFDQTYAIYDGSIYYAPASPEAALPYIKTNITLNSSKVIQAAREDWNTVYNNYYEEIKGYSPVEEKDWDKAKQAGVYKETASISVEEMYTALDSVFNTGDPDGLIDKGNYSIKYLTSGGYPVFEYDQNSLAAKMIELAEARGDCVAILDHTNNSSRTTNPSLEASVYKTITNVNNQGMWSEFATMFTPWAAFSRITADKDDNGKVLKSTDNDPIIGLSTVELPGSFAYLITLADSIKTNANWLAVAGSARGVVQNLASGGMKSKISNGTADNMQPRDGVSINAITNIKPYGYTIWGNRTLKNNGEKGNLTATSFLNVRNLISDVKKQAYTVARQLTFEQNNDVLWVNFKSLISSLLDRMQSGYGISGYKIVRDTEHEKASEKATVCAQIILYPVYAVEDFYITIVLKDDEISVE
jgi:hypothetical protein